MGEFLSRLLALELQVAELLRISAQRVRQPEVIVPVALITTCEAPVVRRWRYLVRRWVALAALRPYWAEVGNWLRRRSERAALRGPHGSRGAGGGRGRRGSGQSRGF